MITVTGFTLKNGNVIEPARVVIICCAADAQSASIHLAGPEVTEAADYPEDTWLIVEGRLDPAPMDAKETPTAAVSSVKRIDKPADTYAY